MQKKIYSWLMLVTFLYGMQPLTGQTAAQRQVLKTGQSAAQGRTGAQADAVSGWARNEWMNGYVKMEGADKAAAAHKENIALEMYKEALNIFERVRRKYPTWNASLLNYRITYCKDQIGKMTRIVRSRSSGMERSQLVQLTEEQTKSLTELEEDRRTLLNRLDVLSESLERARRESARNASVETNLQELTKANETLRQQNDVLTLRLREFDKELAKLKAESVSEQELTQAKNELKLVKEQLERLQKTMHDTTQELEDSRRLVNRQKLSLESKEREHVDQEMALRVVRELSAARKKANDTLLARYQTLEKRIEGLETELRGKDRELLQSQERVRQLATAMDDMKKLQRTAEKSQAATGTEQQELKVLEQDLAIAVREKKELTLERDRYRAQALANQEEVMTLKGELEHVKTRFETSELYRQKLAQKLEASEQGGQAKNIESKLTLEELAEKSNKLDELDAEVRVLRKRVIEQTELARRQEMETRNLRDKLKGASDALTVARTTADEENQRLQKVLGEVREKLTKEERGRDEMEALQAQLTNELNEAKKSNATLQEYLKGRENELSNLRVAVDKREKEAVDKAQGEVSEIQALGNRLEEQRGLLSKREADVETLLKRYDEASRELGQVREERRTLEEKLANTGDKAKQLEVEVERLAGELGKSENREKTLSGDLTKAREETKALQERQAEMQEKVDVVEGMTKTVVEMTDAQQKADAAMKQMRQQVTMLETQLRESDQRSHALEKRLNEVMAPEGMNPEARAAWQREQTERLTVAEARVRSLEKVLMEKESLLARPKSSLEDEADAEADAHALALAKLREDPEEAAKEKDEATKSAEAALSKEEELRQARERRKKERAALVKGFMRQGLDAERQGKQEAARWNYNKVISMDADNTMALQRLGQMAYKDGDDDEAIRYLKQAFYKDPDDAQTLFALGYSYARQSKADWAVAMMGRAVALSPDNATMARVYGVTLLQMGWLDAAEREFRRALKLDPKDKDAAFNLAVLLINSMQDRKARIVTSDAEAKALNDKAKNEIKELYEQAKRLGAEPDPGLEALLR